MEIISMTIYILALLIFEARKKYKKIPSKKMVNFVIL